MISENIFSNREELFQAVADKCAAQLSADVEKKGRASFIVPGGTTPGPVFEKLSKMPLLWSNISVAPSDERWIDVNHTQSNQYLLEQTLLINKASAATLVALKNDAANPTDGEAITELNIAKMQQPFAITMVGMGNDGHFASLFPNTPQIEQALRIDQHKKCLGIDATGCPVAGDYTQRISLTMSALLNSQLVIILITGEQKLEVVRRAKTEKYNLNQPVSFLLNQTQTPVEIYWAE